MALHAQLTEATTDLETMMETDSLYSVLASMPGVAVTTEASYIAETSDKSFDTDVTIAS